jgi:hypothetical protein
MIIKQICQTKYSTKIGFFHLKKKVILCVQNELLIT